MRYGSNSMRSMRLAGRPGARGAVSVGWVIMVMGMGLATVAGVLLGGAAAGKNQEMVATGAVMLIMGALMAVLGASSNSRLVRLRTEVEELSRRGEPPPVPVDPLRPPRALPLLGELLVHKYHLISERDLARALARQRETGSRLGRTLVEMNLMKWSDLARVLEDQISYGDPWHRNRSHKQPAPAGRPSE